MTYQEALLAWYFENNRDLPWRRTRDPYRIWISEIMLQQTQVQTVIPYYERFLSAFPTLEALSKAREEQVLALWQGLGYYGRARRLIPCARQVADLHGGAFPRTLKEMKRLPGIGPYTAGAILSIAFNLPVPAVDGNVMRILARQFLIEADIKAPSSRKVFEAKVLELLPEDRRHFNQALMELGALVCTPEAPACAGCPVEGFCRARREGRVEELPVRSKPAVKRRVRVAMALVRHGGKVLLVREKEKTLLKGLWGLPAMESEEKAPLAKTLAAWLESAWGLEVRLSGGPLKGKHVFTHRVWEIELYCFDVLKGTSLGEGAAWGDPADVKGYPMATVFRKMLQAVGAKIDANC